MPNHKVPYFYSREIFSHLGTLTHIGDFTCYPLQYPFIAINLPMFKGTLLLDTPDFDDDDEENEDEEENGCKLLLPWEFRDDAHTGLGFHGQAALRWTEDVEKDTALIADLIKRVVSAITLVTDFETTI